MMVRVRADLTKCEGYANCIIAAPDVFSIDDDNVVKVLDANPPEGERPFVEEAVRNCPTQALSVEDG